MKLSYGQQSSSIFCWPHGFSTQCWLQCCKLNFSPDAFPPTKTLSPAFSPSLSHTCIHLPQAVFCSDSAMPLFVPSFGPVLHPHICANVRACGMIWKEHICQCCLCFYFCCRLHTQLAAWWCNRSVEEDASLWEEGGISKSRCLLEKFTLCARMTRRLCKECQVI